MAGQTLVQDIVVRTLKMGDIAWSTTAYFMLALVAVVVINRVLGKRKTPVERTSTGRLVLEVVLHASALAILGYIARNVFELVPFPLEGVYGFKHLKVKEVHNSAVFVAFVISFDKPLRELVGELQKRLA
jgi:hypothetical protein